MAASERSRIDLAWLALLALVGGALSLALADSLFDLTLSRPRPFRKNSSLP